MSNETLRDVQTKADAIADIAKRINSQVWWAVRYEVRQPEAFNNDLQQKIDQLRQAIAEFNKLDIDGIASELREELK